jgi:hypothetical protein
LALPPTHPSISSHPLAITIPKNTNSKEYIAVLDLLGAVKRYKGEVRKLKVSSPARSHGIRANDQAEAQNCALVKCIADNAISWIYAPVTKGHVDVEKDDEVIGDTVAEGGEFKSEVVGAGMDNDEIVIDIDDEMEDVPEPASKADEQDQACIQTKAFDADSFQESERRNRIMTSLIIQATTTIMFRSLMMSTVQTLNPWRMIVRWELLVPEPRASHPGLKSAEGCVH